MPAVAQTAKTDSLRIAAQSLSGTARVDVLNQLSFYLLNYNNDLFIASTKEALELSREISYEKGYAEALILSGAAQYVLDKPAESYAQIRQGLKISKKLKENGLVGYGLIQLGINFQFEDRPDSAMSNFRKSYEVLKDSLHPYYLSRAYQGMAECYALGGDHRNELRYLNKCLAIREQLKDETVTWLLIKLSVYYTERRSLVLAENYLNRAQAYFGKDTTDNETFSEIQAQRAVIFFKKGDYPQALNYFYTARRFYEKNHRQQRLAGLLHNIGQVFASMENYDLSLKNYFEALSIAKASHYTLEEIHLNYAIAWSYLRLNQPQRAEEFAEKSLTSALKKNHQTNVADALNLLGMISGAENKDAIAMDYYRRSITIRRTVQDHLKEAVALFNIGTLFEKQGKLDSSLFYQQRALEFRESGNDDEALADSYQLMGRLYLKMHRYLLSEEYLDRSERLASAAKVNYILLNVYLTKRDLLTAEHSFEKAGEYKKLYDHLKDSIFENHLSSRLRLLENIYELQEKENEIVRLTAQRRQQQDSLAWQSAQIRQQRTIIIFVIVFLAVVCAVAFLIYRYYRSVKTLNREITERNEEIQAQAEELTESNTLLGQLNEAITKQKFEIEEQSAELAAHNETISKINESLEERIERSTNDLKQAYQELDTFFYRASHDFRRPLTTFMGLAEVAKITLKDSVALELFDKVNETAKSLDKMLFKLQSISDVGAQELIYKEVSLEQIFNLELDNFKSEIQRNHIQVSSEVTLDKPFRSYQALIQIILRNLLENAIDFGDKVQPAIGLSATSIGEEVVIEVKDNGQGIPEDYKDRVFEMYFRANDRSKGNGLGLYIVRKTVQKLNGRVVMTSAINHGTTVRIYLPNQL